MDVYCMINIIDINNVEVDMKNVLLVEIQKEYIMW